MKGRKIQLGLLLLVTGLLFAVAAFGLSQRPAAMPDSLFESPYGDVRWNHELHARLPQFNCQACHHEARAGTTSPESCHKCHQRASAGEAVVHNQEANDNGGEDGQAGPAMTALHNQCIGCHSAVEQGPTDCRGCHMQPEKVVGPTLDGLAAEDGPRTVWLGHIRAQYDPVEFAHKDHAEDYTESCDQCHHHASEVEAVPACRACHATLSTPKGSQRPGLRDAYHKQCIGCHTRMESGPTECDDCHTKGEKKPGIDELRPGISHLGHLSAHYKAVEFDHAMHVDAADDCEQCHHHASEVEEVPACRECHTRPYAPAGQKKLGLVDAYHVQCIKCHQEQDAPTGCDDCHTGK